MAKITQDVRPTNDPSYIGASREPDRQHPNKSLGILFEGIGEGIAGVANVMDNENQVRITDELYNGVDPIRNAQGVDTAIATDGDLWGQGRQGTREVVTGEERYPLTRLNRPPNAEVMDRSVATLTEAWKQGKVSDTAYYSRLESLSRQVRSRYPGYREQIDQKIQQITGVNPANALRREVLQEYNTKAQAARSAMDDEQKFYERHLEDLPADFEKRKQSGNPYSYTEVRQYVGEKVRERQEITDIKSSMELDSKRKTLSKEQAVDGARDIVDRVSNRLFRESSTAAGWKDFEKRVLEASKNGTKLTPEDQQKFETELNRFRAAYELAFDNTISETKYGQRSLRAHIADENEVKKLREGYMARWEVMKNALLDGQMGVFGAAQRAIEAEQTYGYRKLVPTGSLLDKLAIIGKVPGGKEAAAALMARSEVFGPVLDTILNTQIADRVSGEGSFKSQLGDLRKIKGTGNKNQFSTAIDEAVRGVTDPNSPEVRQGHAKALYGPAEAGTLEAFAKDDQVKVYTRLVNPNVTNALKNDPEAFKMYSEWAGKSFVGLMTTHMQMVDRTNKSGGLYQIQWDEATKSFLPQLTPDGQKMMTEAKSGRLMSAGRNFIGIGGAPDYQKIMGRDWDVLTQFNDGLRGYKSVLEAEKKPVAQTIMQQMDTVVGKAQEGTLFDKMWNGLFNSTQPQDNATTEQQMQKRLQEKDTTSQPKPQKSSSLIDMDGNDTQFAYADLKPVSAFVDEGDAGQMIEAVNRGQDPVQVAMRYVDTDETEHRDVLRGFFKQTLGKDVDPRYTPWCAAWMNGLIQSTGGKGTNSLAARSFLDYGTPVEKGTKGDIAVFSRGSDPSKGHVGFFMGYDENGDIKVLGGNQSGKVSVQTYPASRLLGIRKPPKPEQMAQQVQAAGGQPEMIA